MATTHNADGDIITTSAYLSGRKYATIHLNTPLTEDQLADYFDGFHRDAFTAINADLAMEGKHLTAPLVRVDASIRPTMTTVVFAEYRDMEMDD
jgi:hypothetical protein